MNGPKTKYLSWIVRINFNKVIKICLFLGFFYDMYISTSIGGHDWRYDPIDASYNVAMVVLFESQILESRRDER